MSDEQSRFKAMLAAIIKDSTRHLPFALLYPCKVLKDWGDMHLDLQPEAPYSELLPPMTRIPLKVATPGLRVKFQAGAVVWLVFGAAEADAPYCIMPEGAQTEQINLTTSTGARILIDEGRGQTSDDGKGAAGATLLEVRHPKGQEMRMNQDGSLTFRAAAGQTISLDAAGNLTINAPGVVNIDGAAVSLGGGGRPVARVGDRVAGGVIVSGSAKVTAGG